MGVTLGCVKLLKIFERKKKRRNSSQDYSKYFSIEGGGAEGLEYQVLEAAP